MREVKDHHHYNSVRNEICDRVSIYEKYVIDLLLNSEVSDSDRESSIAFELMHHHSCAQFARVLARKRNLPLDVCTVGAVLHDIYVIVSGKYSDHAHKGAIIAEEILNKLGLFDSDEKDEILKIVYYHSDKDVFTDDPYIEFGKDVDVLDSFLYPDCFEYYLIHKKLSVFYHYIERAKKLWSELNIPVDMAFSVLDNYKSTNWLDKKLICDENKAKNIISNIVCRSYEHKGFLPTIVVVRAAMDEYCFFINSESANLESELSDLANNFESLSFERADSLVRSDVDKIFEIVGNNNAAVIWSALGVYEKCSVESERLKEFISLKLE